MSRHAAATTAGRRRTIQRTAAAPVPRRVSGPASSPRRDDARPSRPPRARIDASALAYADGAIIERYPALPARRRRAIAAPRPPRLAYGGAAIASRVAHVALDVSASRMMDRVVRGRVWIGVIACSLIGLVAMQVSMLKLNSGIGNAVTTINTLERTNSTLRGEVTRLSAGERIQPLAAASGFVMPAPADIGYLPAGDADAAAARAVRRMQAPDAQTAGFAGTATAPRIDEGITVAPGLGASTTPAAPAAAAVPAGSTSAATGAAAPATPGATATAPTTAPAPVAAPAASAPAAAAQPAVAQPAAAQPAAAVPAAASSGGAAPPPTTQTP